LYKNKYEIKNSPKLSTRENYTDLRKATGDINTSPENVPVLTNHKVAEAFLDQDLSTLNVTQFKPLRLDHLKPPKRPTKP
jgi:hypothetical protein